MIEEINKSIGIVKLLKQVVHSIKKNVKNEFEEMGLTGSQGMLMGTLAHNGEMKISDLSKRMGLSNSTVSGIIDRLEKQGYVERIRSKNDRRVVYVSVACKFRKKAKMHFSEIEGTIESIMNEATPEEVDKVFEGLSILKEIIERKN